MKTILVYGLKNVVGGIENYLMMMHKYLHNSFKFVFIVEESDNFIYTKRILENDGVIVCLPERHNLKAYTEAFIRVLKKYKRETNTLYVNVGHISFDIIPIRLAINEEYRVITHSHSAMQEPIKLFSYRVRQDVLRTIGMTRLKYSSVERLAVSKRAGDFLYKGKPYKIVPPGIEVERFKYNEHVRERMRNEFGLSNSVVLGFVGRLVAVKNPLFLIDVLNDLKQRERSTKLLVVGDGELKEEMQKKAKELSLVENVIFVGEVNNVSDYLQAMDVLLAPSLSEGMPFVIMEAQSSGLPCICAKNNFPKEINAAGIVEFCDIKNGCLEWVKTIEFLSKKSVDRESMNNKMKESPFNISNASKNLLDMLDY